MENKNRVKTIKTSFTGGNLTNYSGIYPLFKFMKLNHLFKQKISLVENPNQNYSLSQILYAVILGTLSGMNRLIKIENFTLDPLVRYLIKVKMHGLNDLLRKQDWDKIPAMPDWEMTEFYYQAKSWDKPRRFVAMRKFQDMLEVDSFFPVRDYSYFCYVTNIEESPLYLHRLYGDLGESENWIEQLKNQLYAATILTQGFWANEALFLLSVLVYNISVWMRALIDKKAWRQEPLSLSSWPVNSQIREECVI